MKRLKLKVVGQEMKIGLLALFLLLSGCASQPQIGAIIHPAPGEFGANGTCVADLRNLAPCAFSVAVYQQDTIPKLVASLAFVARDADGLAAWRVNDTIALPADMHNKFVRSEACTNHQSPDDAVVAVLANYDRNAPTYIKAAGWAYKLDLPSGKFVKIAADAVDCLAQVGED